MKKTIIVMAAVVMQLTACGLRAQTNCDNEEYSPAIEKILKDLGKKTAKLTSYKGKIKYIFRQPLLDSRTVREGMIYYHKSEKTSMLRINFTSLKQDDEPKQKYREYYIFDGVWLTRIDYQVKSVQKRQMTEPNQPEDAFELARRHFPIIGFGKNEQLKKQFEIKLLPREKKGDTELIHLHLKVKPESIYTEDYKSLDFWIDTSHGLAVKTIAYTTEQDVYEICFSDAVINKKLDTDVFNYKVPESFGEPEVIPLKK